MKGLMIALIALIAAAAGAAVYLIGRVLRKNRKPSAAGNVIPFAANRVGGSSRKSGGQKCSFCKKPSPRLAFYADEQGRAVGVCDGCRPIAERRELLRL